jgi:hypothetical protein
MVMLRRTIKPEIVMSFAPESEPRAPETLPKPEVLLRVPVGLASPLWGLFAGAAISASAWWWMTRWARPQNLEAMFGVVETEAVDEPEVPAIAAPAAEAAATASETTPEPVLEAFVEAVPEPDVEPVPETVAEALIEASPAPFAVGGESAPISPVLEALMPEVVEASVAPKPRKKPTPPAPTDAPN